MTRVRLELMHWTGLRPSQMGRLQADDFRLDEPIPHVAVLRGKGGGLAAVPLVPEGVAAARAFLHAEAFGPWHRSSVNRALAAAARPAGRPPFTTYQIRPRSPRGSAAGIDVADIQRSYGHTRPETTMIYTPPELPNHLAALERLRRNAGTGTLFPARPAPLAGSRLAGQRMIPISVPTTARSAPALGAVGAVRFDAARLAPCPPSVPTLTTSGSASPIAVTHRPRSTCHVATYASRPRLPAHAFNGVPTDNGLFRGNNR